MIEKYFKISYTPCILIREGTNRLFLLVMSSFLKFSIIDYQCIFLMQIERALGSNTVVSEISFS